MAGESKRIVTGGVAPGVLRAAAMACALAGLLALTAPAGERASTDKAAAEWGRAVNGLRCRLTADRAEVPMGSRVVFGLRFRFEADRADAKVGILNRCARAWRATLTLTNTKTGRVFRRAPFDVGMPPPGPMQRDMVLLRSMPKALLRPDRMAVHLLSEKGEQLPPGEYRVAATYTNIATPEVEVYTGADGSVAARPYKGPWRFWKGTLVSAPITLTVTPVGLKEVELKTNSALAVRRTKEGGRDGIAWTWSRKDPIRLCVKRRPGYVVGTRHVLHVFVGGKEVSRGGGGGLRGSAWSDGSSTSYLPPRIVKRVLAGEALKLRAHVVIFETSVPPRHMWAPEAGDYKVLWKGAVVGSLPPPKP